jgi:lycopene beta-cyclase
VASLPPERALGPEFRALVREQWRQARFALLLNRLLYGAFAPDQRHHVLERFYRLPEPTIRRFYALSTTSADRARIVCGRPPRGLSLKVALSKGMLA